MRRYAWLKWSEDREMGKIKEGLLGYQSKFNKPRKHLPMAMISGLVKLCGRRPKKGYHSRKFV